jgi:hypothetical protein
MLLRLERLLWFLGGRCFHVAGWLAARRRSKEPPEVKPFSYAARVLRFPFDQEARDEELMRWVRGESIH